jgi:hypothetical protein
MGDLAPFIFYTLSFGRNNLGSNLRRREEEKNNSQLMDGCIDFVIFNY